MNGIHSKRPRLRSIIVVVMLLILLLPVGSSLLFRLFENELIRQTEQELISQCAVLAAVLRQEKTQAPLSLDPLPLHPLFPQVASQRLLPQRPAARPTQILPDQDLAQHADRLYAIMLDAQSITLTGMRLLDGNGIVMHGREEKGQSLAHIFEVQKAMQGHYTSVLRKRTTDHAAPPVHSISRRTEVRVFCAYPVFTDVSPDTSQTAPQSQQPDPASVFQNFPEKQEKPRLLGILYLSRTPPSVLKRLYQQRSLLLGISALLLLLTTGAGLLLSATISSPLRALLCQMENIRAGNPPAVPRTRPIVHEIADLSERFYAMADTLQKRAAYINRFATHVSHEFKTPLTALQGALELLRDHADMPQAQREKFLKNLLGDTARMKLLVKRLLELAQADILEMQQESTMLRHLWPRLESLVHDRAMRLICAENCQNILLPIAEDALYLVLANLLENSLQHGADQVFFSCTTQADRLHLNLSDNGQGISPANHDKIFTPFFTTKRSSGGTGLGLEICRTVLATYQAEIFLQPAPKGACFQLRFTLTC